MRSHPLVILVAAVLAVCSVGVSAAEDPRALAGKFASVDEMLEYKALPRYNEAPSLAALVAQGLLPPVEERLPEEPLVWKTSVMVDGMGVYGDLKRHSRGTEPAGWANIMGVYSGFEGGEGNKNDGLFTLAVMWMLENPEPVPNLCKAYEWSDDGYTLTMHLMRGVKWSDGVEFTADDILFSYYDNVLDPNVPSPQSAATWTFGGKVTELEKVDDYTIRWRFGEPYPVRVFTLLDSKYNAPIPAHVYRQYHPKYNPSMTYEDYLTSSRPDRLPAVVLGAYVPVYYAPAQLTVAVRNPFYYKVDEAGNQLPYFDAVVWIQDPDWTMRNYRMLTGEVDQAPVQDISLTSLIYQASRVPDARFKFQWGPYTQAFAVYPNFSLNVGIRDERDLALRQLFRTKEFRQALSHALDREAICSIFTAPNVAPYYGGYPSGSPYYVPERVVAYPYNPGRARALLAQLGFVDTNRNGFVNWPSGTPLAGQELVVELMVTGANPDHVAIAEAVAPYFQDIGIDARVRTVGETILRERMALQEFDLVVEPTYSVDPHGRPESVGSISPNTPEWHKAGPNGERELLPFEARISELLATTYSMRDPQRLAETFAEVLTLFTENVYTIPVVEIAYAFTFAQRHQNIPSDMPVFLHDWFHENAPVEILWTPKELQLPTDQYLGYIPTPQTYQAQSWYKLSGTK